MKLTVEKIRRDLDKVAMKHGRMGDETVTVYYSTEDFATLNTETLPKSWYWDECPYAQEAYVSCEADDIPELYYGVSSKFEFDKWYHQVYIFDCMEDATEWLYREEYDFREREIMSRQEALELAGEEAFEWATRLSGRGSLVKPNKLTIQQIRKDLVDRAKKIYWPDDDDYRIGVFYTLEAFSTVDVTTLPKSWKWNVGSEEAMFVSCPPELLDLYRAVRIAEEGGLS